ncbi:MAG: flagellar biosynthesis anti-sigma factor FlgM [Rhodocyclaceae bacterium]|nr:flagellar biosynthesis anti-sigma factor FlgM [Pseudomonadota bacterium]MDQ7973792.1 flagellar biosynthesis anti-sigma factor FlgM [Rhodocyclaceae bacterium]MDQ7999572.1 flagellar biosynthesis anti-sigma factor FlgM [Pseudomonadota bacterium]MDQ8015949.1 flagellar biosynthesis anti-sigma factor FlgM [Pseudomonadota bacterium]
MKIGPLNEAALAAATSPVKADRAAVRPEDGASATAGVPVTVSAAARSLEVSSAGSGIDEAKVAAVRAAIAEGTFTVNAGAIADKMLSNAQEILSRLRN